MPKMLTYSRVFERSEVRLSQLLATRRLNVTGITIFQGETYRYATMIVYLTDEGYVTTLLNNMRQLYRSFLLALVMKGGSFDGN
jgi:hypothetical protein